MSTPQEVAARLIAQAGPLPDHLVARLARRLAKANSEHPQADRKPA